MGYRLMNARVLVDGLPVKVSDLLKDQVLFRILTNEENPVEMSFYPKNRIL